MPDVLFGWLAHTPGLAQPESLEDICQDNVNGLHEGTDGFEWLSIMVCRDNHTRVYASFNLYQAGAVISIQVQLLTSSSMASSTIPRILLTVGLMSELIGVMLVIYFIRFHKKHRRKSSNIYRTAIRVLSELPTLFIFMGIIGVIAALVVDMFDVSVGTAIAMSGVLSLGVVFFVVAWCFGIGRGAAT